MEASFSLAAAKGINLSAELVSFVKEKPVPRDHNFLSFNSAYKYRSLHCGQTKGFCRKNKCVTVFCSQKREFSVVEGRCIDDIYDDLARRLLPTAAAASDPDLKYIVGLAGPPGAGKTTIASEVVQRLNKLWPQKASSMDSQVNPADVAAVLPMDGFHLYRSQLDSMENPEEAHARRGAPWTFNPQLLLTCLKTLRSQGSVYAPSFDHGVGDPVEDDIFVGLQHKVVIVEGNYLLLDDGVWKEISSMFDEKWFVEIDIDKSMGRVLKRHISTGKPPDVAKWRIENNDRPNAELIMKSKKNADLLIRPFQALEVIDKESK
ncbi:putative uridine kinase C227.14 isoform X1 [Cucumis melo]|uniref:Uridine kinase C227.14 isoform X1 n=1 Tax=Cucumis melo TaxID=3656 RepID=A0ABM3L753_CUCME|nr:putative uridine kinase C227.14 isoform X1 [Cucumis melo]